VSFPALFVPLASGRRFASRTAGIPAGSFAFSVEAAEKPKQKIAIRSRLEILSGPRFLSLKRNSNRAFAIRNRRRCALGGKGLRG
jgi:hypothetical protein